MSIDFSIIIPTFRRPSELLMTITSVLAQRGIEMEVFVIDDCPEGSAQGLVESLNDSRLTYIKNPKPSGGIPSLVRNLGWPLAHGDFVHFLDDDDIVPEGHYAAVKKAFLTHPDVGVVFGRVEPFGDAPEEQMQHERDFFAAAARRASISGRFGPKWAFSARMMFDGLLLVTGAGVVRRECVRALAGFDPLMRVREDWDFYARAIRSFGALFLDRVALKYRISDRSLLHYSLDLTETDLKYLSEARARKRAKYRAERGAIEYFAVKLFAKTILTVL
jgi:glycosyltransferase involved in cell wall biosynthesis